MPTASRSPRLLAGSEVQVSRRLSIARASAPTAPMAPPSVGVATPMKIVPSTRKISASGGTMTKMTCSASTDNSPIRSSLLRTAKMKASVIATDMVRTTKSAPAFTVVVRM